MWGILMDEDFDILVAKVLAGDASAEERARLNELLSRNAELERDFNGLKENWNVIREIGPLADALEAHPASLPPARLSQLQALVRARFDGVRADKTAAQEEVGPCQDNRETAGLRQPNPVQLENAREGVGMLKAARQ